MASGNLKPFAPGQSGNPTGRPKGSPHKYSEAFLAALLADWRQHGRAVIAAVRAADPAQYLKLIARVIPKRIDAVASDDLGPIIKAARDSLKLH